MSTYIIGDIHGCFTQFDELRNRIEANDPDAMFILVGDIVARGSEDEKMLAWAYKNITPDGKYQMVLGNHDDGFIAVFGKDEFETIYSLDNREPPFEEFEHLTDKELMYKYAAFLAKQPLVKKLEVNGQNYVIVHAWYEPECDIETKSKTAFRQRYCLIWERFLDDYTGEIRLKYNSVNNEKLIHGHTPTIFPKNATYKGFSPGKVWDMGGNIDIDCGLVFNINRKSKYGNLAAYNLETGNAVYLFDIKDDYVSNDGEYLDDKLERQKKERLELQRLKQETREKANPYLKSFYKQVFNLDELPDENDTQYRCDFNFLDNYMFMNIDTGYENKNIKNGFDFENEPLLAMIRNRNETKEILYLYNLKHNRWIDVEINLEMVYHAIYKYNDRFFLLSANHYNNEFAEISIYVFLVYEAKQLLCYKVKTPNHYYDDSVKIMENDIKLTKARFQCFGYNYNKERMEPNGLVACDFYDGQDLFTVKILKNHGDSIFVRILDSQKNVLAEIKKKH